MVAMIIRSLNALTPETAYSGLTTQCKKQCYLQAIASQPWNPVLALNRIHRGQLPPNFELTPEPCRFSRHAKSWRISSAKGGSLSDILTANRR